MITIAILLLTWSGILGIVAVYYMHKLKNWGWVMIYLAYTLYVLLFIIYILHTVLHNCVEAGISKGPLRECLDWV